MKTTKSAIWAGALLLVVGAALTAGCSGDEAEEAESAPDAPAEAQPKHGGTLRVAVVRGHSTFDPPIVLAVPDIVVTRLAYDNLILRDPDDLSLIPLWPSTASKPVEGVAAHTPDVILMDSQMPDMDGVEATRRIKEASPGVKVLFLTVHPSHIPVGLAAGADAALLKDVGRQELLTAIRKLAGAS